MSLKKKGGTLPKPSQFSTVLLILFLLMQMSLTVRGDIGRLGTSLDSLREFRNQAPSHSHNSDDSLVVPGLRAGRVRLGDPEEAISKLFPRPSVSRSPSLPDCGMQYLIGLLQDARHPGALNVFVKEGKVVEIETIQGHYRTADGIASNSPPEDVRAHYEGLTSYLFLRGTPEALNEGPLVVWPDESKGIAFSFAHRSRTNPSFSVYSIIVFKPGSSFCVEDSVVPDPTSWRKLAPYSLGPPNAKAEKSKAHIPPVAGKLGVNP
jgi:hypothetical protein